MTPYTKCASDPKTNAQLNLCGRTHYVDDATLKFHCSRVLSARAECDGLIFAIVESLALDHQNKRRGFRYVLFDIAGHVISRVKLENCFRTASQAEGRLGAALMALDPIAVTVEAIDRAEREAEREIQYAREMLAKKGGPAIPSATDETERRRVWWAEGEALGLFPVCTIDVDDVVESLDEAGYPVKRADVIEAAGAVAEYDWSHNFEGIRDAVEEYLEQNGMVDFTKD